MYNVKITGHGDYTVDAELTFTGFFNPVGGCSELCLVCESILIVKLHDGYVERLIVGVAFFALRMGLASAFFKSKSTVKTDAFG